MASAGAMEGLLTSVLLVCSQLLTHTTPRAVFRGAMADVGKPRRRIAIGSVLAKTRAAGESSARQQSSPDDLLVGPEKLTEEDINDAWRRLLEETLPPEKQEALWETYNEEPDLRRKYNMLLEFSSYLRQGASTADVEDVKASTRARVRNTRYPDADETSLCWELTRVMLIVALIVGAVVGGAYYIGTSFEVEPLEEVAAAAAAALESD